jgi:hypothetical protein
MQKINDNVSIKIQTGVYEQFRYLNNKVWYALGEYVDNAIQSFENNRSRLKQVHGSKFTLNIRIDIQREEDKIRILDNAAGIGLDNYFRAFEPANIPIDNSGLHEYGMGMKTASIWLSDVWSVRTKALGETEERFVEFDLKKVIREKNEVLQVVKKSKPLNDHYTEIILTQLSLNAPTNHQIDKIKKHLASIYRLYIRKGDLNLYINDELLTYTDPAILVAPYYKELDGPEILWKKEISFKSGKYSVKGFIGILKTMSTNKVNGISLFRRGRVIVGSFDEKYRPKVLCGQMGSPRYKRIFGELELEGFKVSFNKGSFVEVEELEVLMEGLKLEISHKGFDLYGQAEKYVKPKTKEHNIKVAKNLVKELKKAKTKNESYKPLLDIPTKNEVAEQARKVKEAEPLSSYEDKEIIRGVEYVLKQEFITDPSISSLYTLDILEVRENNLKVVYKINLASDFFSHFERFKKESDYKPIIIIIKSLVLAELVAQKQGTIAAGNIRLNFNNFLNNL